jgi:hypothetical protein
MKADIVERLRAWVHTVKAVPASDLMDEAADEIERLRNGSLVVCETVRLTAWEREATVMAASVCDASPDIITRNNAAMLRSLLERTK